MSDAINTTLWEQVREESLAAMTETERAEYDAAAVEAEARLQLAELVYPQLVHDCAPSSDEEPNPSPVKWRQIDISYYAKSTLEM